ncbi:hypothetical protein SAY86_007119 [Trapa natans]|uniref:TPX2 C-terminal domain-containing protein n=1 Tax=Trapa natans TaxID=22666 RepID=A0AAN7LCZ4_TRANT|nr:hypothetical protein SAY86_007119 [Trapa natans]
MGDSSICLMQPFSYASAISTPEAMEVNPIHALGQSISFGRFASESLSWEKWSTFSHKRYVEEAERYSRPGSVAEKKAFFEAHYKRMAEKKKAEAALLAQANAAAGDASQTSGVTDSCISTSANADLEKTIEPNKENNTNISDSNAGSMLDESRVLCKEDDDKDLEKEQSRVHDLEKSPLDSYATPKSKVTQRNCLDKKMPSAHKWLKPLNLNPMKEMNLLSSAAKRKTESLHMDRNHPGVLKDCPKAFKTPIKLGSESSDLATPLSDRGKANNAASGQSKTCIKSEDNNATPKREPTPRNSLDKKLSAHKWLKPLNVNPMKEINLSSPAAKRKTESLHMDRNHPGVLKDCPTAFKTPIKVGSESSALATPLSERRKANNDGAGEGKTCTKRRSLATECSKFLNKCKNKLQSPIMSTPFRLRTEERAARRREAMHLYCCDLKLEDKFNAEKAQNAPLRTKLKGIEETESRKWRPTFCFTAGPLPGDLKDMRRAEDLMKKVPAAPQPPKLGRKPETRMVKNAPLPSKAISTKSNGSNKFLGKTFLTTAQHRAAENAARALKNTSPNIQPV